MNLWRFRRGRASFLMAALSVAQIVFSHEPALVLLRYKLLRARCRAALPQHGQRGKCLTIAAMSLRRMVAIEFGMCRSGRKGGSSGSVTVGYGKLREQSGGARVVGGDGLPLLAHEFLRCGLQPAALIVTTPAPSLAQLPADTLHEL